MFLRNKMAILSFTLMSLMTIPTLAENDNAPVNSRIENANFDVQIKTPEGWSQTEDFKNVIPETFKIGDQTFRSLQFKNGSEHHGCAVFFAEDSWVEVDEDDDEDNNLIQTLAEVQELAFPGSSLTQFAVSKVTIDGSLTADVAKQLAKVNLKGTIEGSVSNEAGDPTNLTIAGSLQADSSKGNFAVGSGTFAAEGATPVCGTTGILMGDDYQVIIAIWGSDEESQIKDTYRFLEAITVTSKAPKEVVETVAVVVEVSVETVIFSQPVVEQNTVAATESTEEQTSDAVVVTEDAVVVTEAPAEPVVEVANDAVVAAAEPVVEEVVQTTSETPEASA